MAGDWGLVLLRVAGSSRGTRVTHSAEPADLTIAAPPDVILALMSGVLDPAEGVSSRRISIDGDRTALPDFPRMFDVVIARSQQSRPQAEPRPEVTHGAAHR
jgi:putative sterol carrier protein